MGKRRQGHLRKEDPKCQRTAENVSPAPEGREVPTRPPPGTTRAARMKKHDDAERPQGGGPKGAHTGLRGYGLSTHPGMGVSEEGGGCACL